jgi:hypothetical protein
MCKLLLFLNPRLSSFRNVTCFTQINIPLILSLSFIQFIHSVNSLLIELDSSNVATDRQGLKFIELTIGQGGLIIGQSLQCGTMRGAGSMINVTT